MIELTVGITLASHQGLVVSYKEIELTLGIITPRNPRHHTKTLVFAGNYLFIH